MAAASGPSWYDIVDPSKNGGVLKFRYAQNACTNELQEKEKEKGNPRYYQVYCTKEQAVAYQTEAGNPRFRKEKKWTIESLENLSKYFDIIDGKWDVFESNPDNEITLKIKPEYYTKTDEKIEKIKKINGYTKMKKDFDELFKKSFNEFIEVTNYEHKNDIKFEHPEEYGKIKVHTDEKYKISLELKDTSSFHGVLENLLGNAKTQLFDPLDGNTPIQNKLKQRQLNEAREHAKRVEAKRSGKLKPLSTLRASASKASTPRASASKASKLEPIRTPRASASEDSTPEVNTLGYETPEVDPSGKGRKARNKTKRNKKHSRKVTKHNKTKRNRKHSRKVRKH